MTEQVAFKRNIGLFMATTKIEAGDYVVFVGPTSAIKKAQDVFLIKE